MPGVLPRQAVDMEEDAMEYTPPVEDIGRRQRQQREAEAAAAAEREQKVRFLT